MSINSASREFDLNIEKVLQGWEVCHGIREVIANALDEQALTGTKDPEIKKDKEGAWHVRDFGRGLKYEHLTENENEEKLQNAERVIGKFGVGLKDALATLQRRKVMVRIQSKHGDITLKEIAKHGFEDVITLHAVIRPPSDSTFIGSDFAFQGVDLKSIESAKNFFLKFSGEQVLDKTSYGQILRRQEKRKAHIYVKGLLVAEEENFAFSYNITSLTAAMNTAMNRERTNVGRTAYTERVKAMLLESNSSGVATTLAEELEQIEKGTNHDEVNWEDVRVHACQICNATKKVIFVTSGDLVTARDSIDHAMRDGYDVITVPETTKQRVKGLKDTEGNPVRDITVYESEWAKSFEFKFIAENKLTPAERKVFAMREKIVQVAGGLPPEVKQIKISETMRPNFITRGAAVGLWEASEGRIIIKRTQLGTIEAFAGTLLHELTHARTGHEDVSREFEAGLTNLLGTVSAWALGEQRSKKHWWNF